MSGRAATKNVIPGQYALSVGDASMPAPPGWRWTPLLDVARLESGHTPSRRHPEWWDGDVPWIGIKDARLHHGEVIAETLQSTNADGLANSAARLLPAGTVCLSRTASVGYVVVMGRPMATSQDFVNWVLSDEVDGHWLKHLFIAEKDALVRFAKGTTHSTIYYPEVKAFHVCLPPLPEQRRIVARIESLQARSRRAKEALDAIPPLLERFRQSVLAAAFRGDLTADWRRKNPDVEPASVLLERIRAERKRRWIDAEAEKARSRAEAKSQKAGKPWAEADDRKALEAGRKRAEKRYKEPQPVDPEGLPELPEGWCWSRAEEVCEWITKGSTPPKAQMSSGSGEVPFVKVYNLTFDGTLDFTVDPTFVPATVHEGALARSRCRPGDCLMNIVGPPLGKVSIVPDSHPEWNINQAIGLFRAVPGLAARYLALHLLRDWTVSRAKSASKATSGQFNLTLAICRDLPVPLAPEAEQRAALQAVTDFQSLSAEWAEAPRLLLEKLDQAVLAKAFRGHL